MVPLQEEREVKWRGEGELANSDRPVMSPSKAGRALIY